MFAPTPLKLLSFQYPTPVLSAFELEHLRNPSIKNAKIISMPEIGANGRGGKSTGESAPNTDPGTSQSGLKMNIDGKGSGKANGIAHLHSQEYDEDDDFGDEEMDDFDDSFIQSAAAILDRGEKKLYNKLRPNDEWSAKVVSTPNIWHKD